MDERAGKGMAVRSLSSSDFPLLMELEERILGVEGEQVLGLVNGSPAGYALCVVRGREACCSTLAVAPEDSGTRLVLHLTGAVKSAPLARGVESLVSACARTTSRRATSIDLSEPGRSS